MTLKEIRTVIEDRFLDIVITIIESSPDKLRLIFRDGSFIDIRISQKIKNRFDFHWERRHVDQTIYRYDNFPNTRFRKIKTFPYHFHKEKESKVTESPFRKELPLALIDFMEFIRETLKK